MRGEASWRGGEGFCKWLYFKSLLCINKIPDDSKQTSKSFKKSRNPKEVVTNILNDVEAESRPEGSIIRAAGERPPRGYQGPF